MIDALPPHERAAAIAHHIYVLTAKRTGWELRVPEAWSELPESAKQFNMEAVTTWSQQPELAEAWQQAVEQMSR